MNARIEAATRALFERNHDLPFEAMQEGHKRPYRREAEAALAAADAVMFGEAAEARIAELLYEKRDYTWQVQARAVIAALRDAPHATGEGK